MQDGDNYFAVDFSRKIIIDLAEEGFNIRRLEWQQPNQKDKRKAKQNKQSHQLRKIRKLRDVGAGRGENREWEVGYKGKYDEIDGENSLKM